MFESTRLHENTIEDDKRNFTIKKGGKVPDGAINLAYYYNKQASEGEGVMVAEAPKNVIDHITVSEYMKFNGLDKPDDSLFPLFLLYKDDNGYSGKMNRQWLKWSRNDYVDHLKRVITPEPEEVFDKTGRADRTMPYTEGEYSGILDLQYERFEDHNTISVPEHEHLERDQAYTMVWPDEIPTKSDPGFPATIEITDVNDYDGFTGTLMKVPNTLRYTATSVKEKDVALPPIYVQRNGKNDFPVTVPKKVNGKNVNYKLLQGSQKKVWREGKAFGWGRSLGNYLGPEPWRGYYGAPFRPDGSSFNSNVGAPKSPGWATENRIAYAGSKYLVRGYFSDPYPKYYDVIWSAVHGWAAGVKVPAWGGGTSVGTTGNTKVKINGRYLNPGTVWSVDVAEGKRWGSDNNQVWTDKYRDATNRYKKKHPEITTIPYWPPYGYNKNQGINGCGPSVTTDSNEKNTRSSVNFSPRNKDRNFHIKANPPIVGNVVNKGYRDFVAFYRYKEPVWEAKYTCTIPGKGKDLFAAYQDYRGVLEKTVTTYKDVVTSWLHVITYAGIISKEWSTHDGIAFYQGIATKRTAVGNINPEGRDNILMYPDDSNILRREDGTSEIESELFYITNMFKDDEPLHYMYKLKLPIYDSQGPDDYGMYRGDAITLVNSNLKPLNKNRYKYQVKLVPYKKSDGTTDSLYEAYIYTNFVTTLTNTVNCIYNAYSRSAIDDFHVKPSVIEEINVQPFNQVNKDYYVVPTDARIRRNYIKLDKTDIISDSRRIIDFTYEIKTSDGKYNSGPISAKALNRRYALDSELDMFDDRNYIVSLERSESFMNAYEIVAERCKVPAEDLEALKEKIFVAKVIKTGGSSHPTRKLNIYTEPSGKGVVSVETTEDTGFYNPKTGNYDKVIKFPGRYKTKNGKIYPAYMVKCRDVRVIKALSPKETNLLDSWYARVQFGHFNQVMEQHGVSTRITYTIPEYDKQDYSTLYGKPYMDIKGEKCKIIDSHSIKTKNFPLYVQVDKSFNPLNLVVKKVTGDGKETILNVDTWSFTEGIVTLREYISINDLIIIDYTYEETNYEYRGFYKDKDFIDIEFNPNMYHTYLDNTFHAPKRREVYHLFNKIVYFFLRPTMTQLLDVDGKPIKGSEVFTENTIYHQINEPEPEASDHLMIGSMYCRSNTSLKATEVIDTRSRGGGVLEEMLDQVRRELEPDSDYYWDIGYADGEPYTENAAIVIRIDRRILKRNGGRFSPHEIEAAVGKWVTAGVVPIIEYVQTFGANEHPQSSIRVEGDCVNKLDYTPFAFVSVENNL